MLSRLSLTHWCFGCSSLRSLQWRGLCRQGARGEQGSIQRISLGFFLESTKVGSVRGIEAWNGGTLFNWPAFEACLCQRLIQNAYRRKAQGKLTFDLFIFLFGPYPAKVPKGQPFMSRSFGQQSRKLVWLPHFCRDPQTINVCRSGLLEKTCLHHAAFKRRLPQNCGWFPAMCVPDIPGFAFSFGFPI